MKKRTFPFLVVGFFSILLFAHTAFATSWIDWSDTSSGQLTIGSNTVDVSLTGMAYSLIDGDYYYNNSDTGYTDVSGTYGGLMPYDVIQERYTGSVTLDFSEAVVNPYIALVSVGQSFSVDYSFLNLQNPIDVISYGDNYWGYGSYSITDNVFSGYEFNGILQLLGTYDSISFDISPNEYWHGFNIGADSTAPVPEPSTILLLGSGLAGLAFYRRKRK